MVVLKTFILLITIVILWILLSRIEMEINSDNHLYRVRFGKIIEGNVEMVNLRLKLIIQAPFFKKTIEVDPWDSKLFSRKQLPEEKESAVKKKKKGKGTINFATIRRLVSSFKIHQFRLNLDTDDWILNSYLFPIFYFSRFTKVQMNVNYLGYNAIHIKISNRIIRILIAYFFKPKPILWN